MTTLNTMVKQCTGLLGTGDLKPHEESFIGNVRDITKGGDDTRPLTEKQITWLEDLYDRHFVNG